MAAPIDEETVEHIRQLLKTDSAPTPEELADSFDAVAIGMALSLNDLEPIAPQTPRIPIDPPPPYDMLSPRPNAFLFSDEKDPAPSSAVSSTHHSPGSIASNSSSSSKDPSPAGSPPKSYLLEAQNDRRIHDLYCFIIDPTINPEYSLKAFQNKGETEDDAQCRVRDLLEEYVNPTAEKETFEQRAIRNFLKRVEDAMNEKKRQEQKLEEISDFLIIPSKEREDIINKFSKEENQSPLDFQTRLLKAKELYVKREYSYPECTGKLVLAFLKIENVIEQKKDKTANPKKQLFFQ